MNIESKLGIAGLALVAGLGCGPKDTSRDLSSDGNVASMELSDALWMVNREKSRLAHKLAPWGEGVGVDSNNRLQAVYCDVGNFEPAVYRHVVEDARQAISEIYSRDGLVVDSFDNESIYTKSFFERANDVIVCGSSVATHILDKDGHRVPTSRDDLHFEGAGGDR